MIHGHVDTPGIIARDEFQGISGNRHGGIWRNDENAIGSDLKTFRYLGHGHFRLLGNQLRQNAVVSGVEVLDKDKSQARVCRQVSNKLRKRFDTPGRGADGDNREVFRRRWR